MKAKKIICDKQRGAPEALPLGSRGLILLGENLADKLTIERYRLQRYNISYAWLELALSDVTG